MHQIYRQQPPIVQLHHAKKSNLRHSRYRRGATGMLRAVIARLPTTPLSENVDVVFAI